MTILLQITKRLAIIKNILLKQGGEMVGEVSE